MRRIAACHCGAVEIEVVDYPVEITHCNCSLCRAHGVLWAYYTARDVVSLPDASLTHTYAWNGRNVDFHRCRNCGCVTHWFPRDATRDRRGINARLFPAPVLDGARIRYRDGAGTGTFDEPSNGLECIARQWIGLWTAPVDWQCFDRLHDASFEDCAAAGRAADKAGFAQGLRNLLDAFPDLETEVEDLVVDRNAGKVCVRWSARGTNVARYLGTGPTRRMTTIRGIEIIEIVAGRIVRRWGEWDIGEHTGSCGPPA